MIQAMVCTPWSVTVVWKTMPVTADAAIEPRYPNVRSRPEAVPSCSAGA
jgi:hypothetical protein